MLMPILPLMDAKTASARLKGNVGELIMAPVSSLVIDDTYQRAVSAGSVRVIKRIVADFDWNKFTPIIGVRNDAGSVSVIDGQHRAIAAATLEVDCVPCYLMTCTVTEASAAFAAINGNVTPVSPVDLWFATVAAGDVEALAIKATLDAADVRIVRRRDGFDVGETRSINVLKRAYHFYGASILTTILQCITDTGKGNAGLLIGSVINGVGHSIRTKTDLLAAPSKLFDQFDRINLPEELRQAQIEYASTGQGAQYVLTRRLNARLKAMSS